MRHKLVVLLLGLVFVNTLMAQPEWPSPTAWTRMSVNMYADPATTSLVIRSIPAGKQVFVNRYNKGHSWSYVGYQGTDGWVLTTYLRFSAVHSRVYTAYGRPHWAGYPYYPWSPYYPWHPYYPHHTIPSYPIGPSKPVQPPDRPVIPLQPSTPVHPSDASAIPLNPATPVRPPAIPAMPLRPSTPIHPMNMPITPLGPSTPVSSPSASFKPVTPARIPVIAPAPTFTPGLSPQPPAPVLIQPSSVPEHTLSPAR